MGRYRKWLQARLVGAYYVERVERVFPPEDTTDWGEYLFHGGRAGWPKPECIPMTAFIPPMSDEQPIVWDGW